jgi:hypothetical protein
MKIVLLALAMVVSQLAACAQGRVTTGNDANHLVVFATNAASLPARYASYAGQPVPQIGTTNDQFQYFTVDLLAGMSPTELTLQHVATPAGGVGRPPGRLYSAALTLTNIPPIPAGPTYFQHRVWETAGGSYENAAVRGQTPVFQAIAGSFAYNFLTASPYWLAAPIVLAAAPQTPAISAPTLDGNQIRFSFMAQSNFTYTVEYCDSLTAANWTMLTNIPAQPADGTIQISDTVSAAERYFRVRAP